MNKEKQTKEVKERDAPKKKQTRKPSYLKDRKTSSGVTFWG